jgi:holo-[acyl-carrier protein] synthase
MSVQGIGVDAVEIARFRTLVRDEKNRFMTNTFSAQERAYCLSYKDPSPHFAGTFAAKEAVQKASGLFALAPTAIEIVRTKAGKPEVWLQGKRSKSILISITHEKKLACAVAIYSL